MRRNINLHKRHKQAGVTIIEAVVAMVIFSVGILGMSSLQLRVLQETNNQHQRDTAIWKTQALIERIGLNNSAAAITLYETNINNEDFCADLPTVVCADTYNLNTAEKVSAAVCSDIQMADYDSWEILCDDGSIGDKLNNVTPDLICTDNLGAIRACTPGLKMELTFTWESLTGQADSRLTGNTTIVQGNDGQVITVAANIERYRMVFLP